MIPVHSNAIERYSVASSNKQITISATRLVLKATGDAVRIGYNDYDTADGGNYWLLADGEVLVFDPPNLIGELVYVRADSSTATLSVWRLGC